VLADFPVVFAGLTVCRASLTRSIDLRVRSSSYSRSLSYLIDLCTVPLAVLAGVAQASIYDVPGGYRAVMFDRFTGVKDKVSALLCYVPNPNYESTIELSRRHSLLNPLVAEGHPL
jgi:hypothetical protein